MPAFDLVYLLKNSVPKEHGKDPARIVVPAVEKNGLFTLTDPKSCTRCRQLPDRAYRKDCDNVILNVDTQGKQIVLVHYEEYISQFPKVQDNRCDYLMTETGVEHDKIVFCDLCCYEEKYVNPNGGQHPEGKRAYARHQMEQSIKALVSDLQACVNILTYPERVCLFAWRDYDMPETVPEHGVAEANMGAFNLTASYRAAETFSDVVIGDSAFKFVQVKHPTVYRW